MKQRGRKNEGENNNAPVVRQDAPEMLPSDAMFHFHCFFLRFFCVFFPSASVLSFHVVFLNFERNFHGTTVSRM